MTLTDPYTMELRLCDDHGMVSHERAELPDDRAPGVSVPAPESYLDRLNRLRALSLDGGEKPYETITEPFACTGHAHLAGEHIRCTSPAHQQTVPIEQMTPIGTTGLFVQEGYVGPQFTLGEVQRAAAKAGCTATIDLRPDGVGLTISRGRPTAT